MLSRKATYQLQRLRLIRRPQMLRLVSSFFCSAPGLARASPKPGFAWLRGPVLDRTWPERSQNYDFCMGPGPRSGQSVASTLPKPWFLHGPRASFWPERGQHVAKTMVFARSGAPVLARGLPKPWFLHGSRAPAWQEPSKTMVLHGSVACPSQPFAKTMVFACF